MIGEPEDVSDSKRVLGLSGSLRGASIHRGVLRAASEIAPSGMEIETFDVRGVPFFDGDLEKVPSEVESLRAALTAADGVLFASPEYNFSVSGVLKNALDWASRPAYASPMAGKKCAIVSASPGPTGGARGQQHLKIILLGMASEVFPHKEMTIGGANSKFNESGDLIDEAARQTLAAYLEDFFGWL